MKKFLLRSLLFFTIIFVLIVVINFIGEWQLVKSTYMEAIVDKHQRVESINEPKILLVGGSNLAFGMDSKVLEQELKVPIVNMGLHAGLGLSFMIEEAKRSVEKGDVIILSLEYFLSTEGNYRLKKQTSDFFPEAKRYYDQKPYEDFKMFFETTQSRLKNLSFRSKPKQPTVLDRIYSRGDFNPWGDMVGHLDVTLKDKKPIEVYLPYRKWDGIEILNNFHTYVSNKGAQVFFVYPNFPKSHFDNFKENIKKLQTDLDQNLTIEILNTPEDFVFEDHNFFDTEYHLKRDAIKSRTLKLVEFINNNEKAAGIIKNM